MIDPLVATVRIPIRIKDSQPVFFYGGPLPRLEEGSVADLVVPRSAVTEPALLEVLLRQEERTVLDAGTELLIEISLRSNDRRLEDIQAVGVVHEAASSRFARLRLNEPLRLLLRGTNRGVLRPCTCEVVQLREQATSLNEAYSIAVRAFEPWRRSHTGNVFKKLFYRHATVAGKKHWRPLETLRFAHEARFDGEIARAIAEYRAALESTR